MTTEDILNERQKTHGEFSEYALIAQKFKFIIQQNQTQPTRGVGNYLLSTSQYEALEMICNKMARILNGNPNHKDHWDDIAGYATLISKALERMPNAANNTTN